MENNNIQNNKNIINLEKPKENIENKTNKNKQTINKDKDNENSNTVSDSQNNITSEPNLEEKNKKIKYRMNFSVRIDYLREISDKKEKSEEVEFNSNILLMSSEVNQSNKISCLTLISYVNHQKNYALYIYYLNKKIFKYIQTQKGIESFIYIRTLYRAAYFLEKDKNFFYAYKYVMEAASLSENSKINAESKELLRKLKLTIAEGLRNYGEKYVKKFRDVESPNNLNEDNYNKLKQLFKLLIENKYDNKEKNENKNEDEYLYIINKKWVDKAYNFLKDYIHVRDNNIKGDYFKTVFTPDKFYHPYFEDDTKNEKETKSEKEKEKTKNKYYLFPGLIDNYSISNWTDFWNDPLNEDENNFIQPNLVYNKDYYLLEKSDFEFLKDFFGVTNIIKRKKNCLDFVIIKTIIFDKRFKNNSFLLRRRNFQLRNYSTIKDFKDKIIRCVEDNLAKIEEEKIKEKENAKKDPKNKDKTTKSGENDDKAKKNNKINDDKKNNDEKNSVTEGGEGETKKEDNEKKENENTKTPDIKNIKYNIYFYLLEKEKKDVLIDMCLSFVNEISQYDSLYIKKIDIEDSENISKLFTFFDKRKYILIIDIQHNDDPLFLKQIANDNNKYFCSQCQKEILSLDNIYKCNLCHMSLFCSEECSFNNKDHKKLDDIYYTKYLVEEFDLNRFLKKNLNNFFEPDQLKGLVGLSNLGNTCYMNSALQCLSNTFDLTKYFLFKYFENDINRGNKLGSNGSIANEYYKLIYSMWCGKEQRIAPRDFIKVFQKEKSQFAGYRQQDSQEFISILLDQLHEDLNRISNKPYIELLEKQPNEDDITASKRWWDLHKKREDSIIIDLFNGQLKSETTCQVCNKSSITYDPFMFLCLPLPKSQIHLMFKVFCGIECKIFDFEYFENCTLLDLNNRAFEFIKTCKQSQTAYFDLEIVQLDYNKKILQTLSCNVKDKNFKGKTDLRSLLVNRNEIIFFEKNIIKNEKDYIKIFIYPIESQTPEVYNYGRITTLQFISYPLLFQLKNDITINEFAKKLFERLNSLNFINSDKVNYYDSKKLYHKVLDINIIHGKETKKEGFLTWFSMEDTCKYCNKSNEQFFYCSIFNFTKEDKTLLASFNHLKKPIVLLATSDCYNLSGDGLIYLESNLFINNSDTAVGKYSNSIKLKDCLDLYGQNIELKDDDMWYCSKCKKHQISKQKLQIYKAPNYLIIQIKRFNIKKYGSSSSTFSGEKNDTFVSYPITDLNLSDYIVGPEKDKNNIYDLYGVVQHFGSLSGGHYTAICKNDGNWISYNDSSLDIVNNPVTKNAYILFYKRKESENKDNNVGNVDNKDKISNDDNKTNEGNKNEKEETNEKNKNKENKKKK